MKRWTRWSESDEFDFTYRGQPQFDPLEWALGWIDWLVFSRHSTLVSGVATLILLVTLVVGVLVHNQTISTIGGLFLLTLTVFIMSVNED